jgi:hypothetical protein
MIGEQNLGDTKDKEEDWALPYGVRNGRGVAVDHG